MNQSRGRIIQTGLERANRTDLLPQARYWLNNFLDRMYLDQDFEWLLKYVYGRTLVNGDTLPTDYTRMKTVTVTNQRIPMQLVEADQWEYLQRGWSFPQDVSGNGTPNFCYIDQSTSLIYFFQIPQSAPTNLTYNYYYYYYPTLPDAANPTTDTQIPIWGRLSSEPLIQEIYARALEYQDDLRAKDELDKVLVMVNLTKQNSRDLRAGSPRFKLGKCHPKRRF